RDPATGPGAVRRAATTDGAVQPSAAGTAQPVVEPGARRLLSPVAAGRLGQTGRKRDHAGARGHGRRGIGRPEIRLARSREESRRPLLVRAGPAVGNSRLHRAHARSSFPIPTNVRWFKGNSSMT